MADKDLEYGQRAIIRIQRDLDEPEGLAHEFAKAVLAQAVQNAASRPTPQARMAAAIYGVRGPDVIPLAGGAPWDVAMGSEFGSNIYLQFQAPHNPRGYWLFPAGESTAAALKGDKALDDILKSAVRSA